MNTARKQRGAAFAFAALALAALVVAVGFALDTGHLLLNMSKLQNVVDAAALEAAKTLDLTGDTGASDTAARDLFADNLGEPGNEELDNPHEGGQIQVDVEFSSTLTPFVPGSNPPEYVRVRASNFQMSGWFLPLFGLVTNNVPTKEAAASAVAGPSPTLESVCDMAPLMVCGDTADHNPDANPPRFFGYTIGDLQELKIGSGPLNENEVGSGNFQAVRLSDSSGGNDFQHNLAGREDACLDTGSGTIETEPGNMVGPARFGLNTRFGQYQGQMHSYQDDYPPDLVVTAGTPTDFPDYRFSDYQADLSAENFTHPSNGKPGRRIMRIPVGDCELAQANGHDYIPLLGVACFFVLDKIHPPGGGNGGGNGNGGGGNGNGGGNGGNGGGQSSIIYGEFIDACGANGNPGPNPGSGPGPYRIQLYKDAGNVGS